MNIIAISDTHGKHRDLELPSGDILIHAGDVTQKGTIEEVIDFLDWFKDQTCTHKIFIAGNHDFYFQEATAAEIRALIPAGVTYLNDSGIDIEGISIWGSPITPWYYNWAFQRHRGAKIEKHWDLIPESTDVLVVHGPPKGILDKTYFGAKVGCERLTEAIQFIRPKIAIFGHIHEDRGILKWNKTTCINAAIVDLKYEVKHKPYIVEITGEQRIESRE